MATRGMRWARRAATLGAVGTAAYVVDDQYFYNVGARSLRVVKTGLYLLYEYKLVWTPENSDEVHRRVAHAMAQCLNKNGGMYIKFGQQMTTMSHVLPPEYVEELKVLYDAAETYPGPQMRKVVEYELGGRSIEEVFERFDDEAIASASMAQVHRAKLRSTGEEVAVKIQKPPLRVTVDIDFLMAWVVVKVVEMSFGLPLVWSHEYVSSKYKSEIDFRVEAENTRRAKDSLMAAKGVYVPRVIDDCSSRRVLVTEWIDGAVRIDDTDGMQAMGVDVPAMLHDAIDVFAYQIFQAGHVHCDPHPGNLLIRRRGAHGDPAAAVAKKKRNNDFELVLIDHGLCVDLPDKLRVEYAKFWTAMILSDRKVLKEVTAGWGIGDADFFASMTQMRPFKSSRGVSQFGKQIDLKMDPEQMAKMHEKMKGKIVNLLSETAKFPKELMFVGRCLNYLRSHNWSHGNVINRIKILGVSAADGLTVKERFRFHLTLNLLSLLETVKTTFPMAWNAFIWVLPPQVSVFLVRFGAVLDAAPIQLPE